MRNIVKIALCVALTALAVSSAAGQKRTLTWTNPIIDRYLADPCVYYSNGYYYLLATGKAQDGKGIQMYKSADLQKWTPVGGMIQPGGPESWNWKHFWAPEVIEMEGKFYLYYTASPQESPNNSGNRVGAAVADNIEGPYTDLGVVVKHASIDGHPFRDRDGQMYMYYTVEHGNSRGLTAGQIYVEKMTSPTTIDGNPVKILADYEWQEGPIVQNIKGKYILTYSQGGWRDDTYNVRYAVADSPLGPFGRSDNVIMKTNEQVKGPGHHFLFKDEAGNDWIAYHGWDPQFKARYPRIDLITIKRDTVYTNGPTYTPQSIEIKGRKR